MIKPFPFMICLRMSKIKVHVDLIDSNYFPAYLYFHHEKTDQIIFPVLLQNYSVCVCEFFFLSTSQTNGW